MSIALVPQCCRCGTKLRNRKVCPCCGYDAAASEVKMPVATPISMANEHTSGRMIRKVAAKAGVKMCAICMHSTPEEELADENGHLICPACVESLRTKAARKASHPPTATGS